MDEAIRVLEARVVSPTFRRAVGASVVEAVKTLMEFQKCNVCIDVDKAVELLQNLHLFRVRMGRLIEALEGLMGGGLARLLEELDITTGEVQGGREQDIGYVKAALLGEMEAFERYLEDLVDLVRGVRAKCRRGASERAS